MFWKKKGAAAKRKLSPKDVVTEKVEQLEVGQVLKYRLPETFGGGLAVVELNAQHPQNGKKYILYIEELTDNGPSGRKKRFWDTNHAKDLAKWIVERKAELFT